MIHRSKRKGETVPQASFENDDPFPELVKLPFLQSTFDDFSGRNLNRGFPHHKGRISEYCDPTSRLWEAAVVVIPHIYCMVARAKGCLVTPSCNLRMIDH